MYTTPKEVLLSSETLLYEHDYFCVFIDSTTFRYTKGKTSGRGNHHPISFETREKGVKGRRGRKKNKQENTLDLR